MTFSIPSVVGCVTRIFVAVKMRTFTGTLGYDAGGSECSVANPSARDRPHENVPISLQNISSDSLFLDDRNWRPSCPTEHQFN